MNPVRIFCHQEHGWICETPVALPIPALRRAVAYTMKMQRQRISTWPKGDRREQAEKDLAKLSVGTIRQRVAGRYPWEQDRIVY